MLAYTLKSAEKIAAGQMWKYEADRLVSMGGNAPTNP